MLESFHSISTLLTLILPPKIIDYNYNYYSIIFVTISFSSYWQKSFSKTRKRINNSNLESKDIGNEERDTILFQRMGHGIITTQGCLLILSNRLPTS